MNREDILNEYQVDSYGVITSPGKFEGEMVYAPYFYDLVMSGCADDTDYGPDEFSTVYDYFDIKLSDIEAFPELNGINQIVCYETETGFFICRADS